MRMRPIERAIAVLASAAAICLGGDGAAHAQAPPAPLPATELNAEARTQYKLGTEALAAGRYVEAALHFETATSRTPHAVTWYMAAEAWDHASHPERAADALSRALDVPGLSAELGETVRTRLKRLEASLGTVVFGGQTSFRVALDGSSQIAPPARVHGLPGVHVVTIIPPDRAPSRREVTLIAGGEVAILLGEDVAEEPTAAPRVETRVVEREVPRPAEPRKYVGFGVIGLGVATLGAAAILGVSALDARDAYATSRTKEAYDHVRTVQAWANVALVSGLVFAAAGVALVVWPTHDASSTTAPPAAGAGAARSLSLGLGPGSASLGGTF